MTDDRPIIELRNIDPAITQWLHEVGINSADQLREMGAARAYRTMRAWRPWSAELIVLWALEGAINDVDWIDVTPERRLELRREVDPDAVPRPDPPDGGASGG
jgi:DNA transformation protein and related proteins